MKITDKILTEIDKKKEKNKKKEKGKGGYPSRDIIPSFSSMFSEPPLILRPPLQPT